MPVQVRVTNFQSIKEANIEIDGFTVVTGTNNTGKTSLQRAIRGVFQNTPGTNFIRHGETTCAVAVDFGDRKVIWSKGTGARDRPTYIVDAGNPLYPGQAVPSEVAALGVIPIKAGGQDVWPNLAPQFVGQIFLLDKPGSVLAEAVADVERVGQLNRALSRSESDRRSAATTLKVRQADLVKLESDVARFEGLDDVHARVTALAESRHQAMRIKKAVIGLVSLQNRLAAARSTSATLAPVSRITCPDPSSIIALEKKLCDLRCLQQRWIEAKQATIRYEGAASLLVGADASGAERLWSALGILRGLGVRYAGARERLASRQAEWEAAVADSLEAAVAADVALAEIGCCPLCGAPTQEAP